jgi:prepilin-type N-terminal cleavage/methylation domain-containing protein
MKSCEHNMMHMTSNADHAAELVPATRALRGRRGFTLVEVLIAVAALALLSLGIAQIFSLTGRTVAAGRRLATLNSIAQTTERIMRQDLEALTRQGFMVVRNETTRNNVSRSPEDPDAPRRRRIDQLAFFAKGSFTSMREPLTPDAPVTSNEAMIYYGHGLQQLEGTPGASGFTNPVDITTNNAAAPDFGDTSVPGNPNQFASNWVLARRVVLLRPPQSRPSPATGTTLNPDQRSDSPTQIGLQPAVATVFRAIAQNGTSALVQPAATALRGNIRPTLASGVIDIAATDLRTISATLLDAVAVNQELGTEGNTNAQLAFLRDAVNDAGDPNSVSGRMQALMLSALPGDSTNVASPRRMRVQVTAPDLLGSNQLVPLTDAQKADQAMLTSSVFLPRCTEFIVEWSFGQVQQPSPNRVTADNTLIWYGLPRDGASFLTGEQAVRTVSYERPTSGNRAPIYRQKLTRRDGLEFDWPNQNTAAINNHRRLVEPTVQPFRLDGLSPMATFCFGLLDPTYNPMEPVQGGQIAARNPSNLAAGLSDVASGLVLDVNRNGENDPQQGDIPVNPTSVGWAWPKLIRITYSISDPADPTLEQTFQIIVEIPDDRGASTL